MAKYIDTDRLKAKLDEYYREYQSKYMETRTPYTQGLIDALDLAEQVIDSLQQDSRFPQYDNIVDKVFGAGNLESWEYEEAEMLVALAKEELLNSLQQEQPEVDLEKELDQWRHKHFAGERDGHYSGEYLERSSQLDLARHFFNLGLNARKEENK